MRALIVDDEKAARDRLRRMLAAFAEIEIIGEAENGIDALGKAAALKPDVLFLDIEMPALDGLSVARALHGGPRVVFVTAFNDFAVEAFENAAVDYLVKPVTDERLRKTVERLGRAAPDSQPVLRALQANHPSLRFAVKSGAEWHLVEIDRVTAIIAEDDYSVVKGAGDILCDETLDALAERLTGFSRVHRSALVNLARVVRMEREGDRKFVLVLSDNQRVPVSREKIDETKTALGIA